MSTAAREFPLTTLRNDDALVRVAACGLCGTDYEQYTGELSGGFAFVPGHETVGTIEAVGPRAAERWGVAVGDRIAVEVFQSCRASPACLAPDSMVLRLPTDLDPVVAILFNPLVSGIRWGTTVPGTKAGDAGLGPHDAALDLLATMAGERDDFPAIHGVLTP